ncbi:MAG: hypothetical protein WC499_04355 [Patescibacteria group bacterium]
MHLNFFLRGIESQVNIWKMLAQSQFWQWKRKKLKTGKDEITLVQGALRPSILGSYEYVFPEECLPEVLAVLGFSEEYAKDFRLKLIRPIFNSIKIKKKVWREAEKKQTMIIIDGTTRGLANCVVGGVHLIPIGIKKDKRGIWKEIGYEQEML